MTNAMPDVLMLGWELPPENSGGLGVACYGLAKGLSKQGVKISFALPRKMKANIQFMKLLDHKLQGLEVTAINSNLAGYLNSQDYIKQLVGEGGGMEAVIYGQSLFEEAIRFGEMAASWSKSQEHDIIHMHDWMTYPAGMKARKVSGRPLVAHVHATEYDRTGGRVNSQIAEIEYEGLNQADRVIAVSGYTKETVVKYYGIDEKKITVVHNGIDLEEFSPMEIKRLFPRDKIVLYVGRLTFQKGVIYFLRAAKRVLEYEPNTIFMVVGNGDMYERLMMEACEVGVGHRVVFAGFLHGEKLRACYQMADAFVMPSVSEPYGIVALEAIASGTPTIISKQSGVAESLQNVLKVDYWDTQKMADLLISVLSYPRLGLEMARAARVEARRVSWERTARLTLEVYRDLVL